MTPRVCALCGAGFDAWGCAKCGHNKPKPPKGGSIMTLPVQNKFFEFRQNNSGGSFHTDSARGIGEYVIIEAANANEANSLAQQKGIYFDGCEFGQDCSCCGDRWYEVRGEGDPAPSHYGTPFSEADTKWTMGYSVYLHMKNGEVHTLQADKQVNRWIRVLPTPELGGES